LYQAIIELNLVDKSEDSHVSEEFESESDKLPEVSKKQSTKYKIEPINILEKRNLLQNI
jgi:hypothetical protein